jgi:hypothetical protein
MSAGVLCLRERVNKSLECVRASCLQGCAHPIKRERETEKEGGRERLRKREGERLRKREGERLRKREGERETEKEEERERE